MRTAVMGTGSWGTAYAMILADVYLAMTGGQGALALDEERLGTPSGPLGTEGARRRIRRVPNLPVLRASPAEIDAHESMLDRISKAAGGGCLFRAS